MTKADIQQITDISAVSDIIDVVEEEDDDKDVENNEGNCSNDGHGSNDGCDALVQADEPVVKVDDKLVASVDLHNQWKAHSKSKVGKRFADWSPFSHSLASVQDLVEDFSSDKQACILTPNCFQTVLKLSLYSFIIVE